VEATGWGDKVSNKEELRQGSATDVAAIRDLTRAAYAKWVPLIGREPKPMTADYVEALRKHRFDLLYLEGKLVALIETIRGADHLLIENVAVAPPFWGRGFGRKLIAHAEKMTASAGLSETRLYANKLFAENIQLYGKLGYRVDREEKFEGGVVVHMSKPCVPRTQRSA
jgi:GNAT superfamily N-acetyltransferase